ncbi:MAG: hypothetical protein ABI333_22935, partial [bacterium]
MVVLPCSPTPDADLDPALPELLDYSDIDRPKDLQDRLEGGEFLDLRLYQMTRSQGARDRHLGLLLEQLSLINGSIQLGFYSVDDYAVERLGIGRRQAQALRQLARATSHTPALGEAVDRGALTPRKALTMDRLLRQVSEPEVEGWIARATEVSVRELEILVREAVARPEAEPGNEPAAEAEAELAAEPADDEVPRYGRTLELSLATEARWRQARELHGRLDGRDPGADETLEAVAAEYLSDATAGEHDEAVRRAERRGAPRRNDPAAWNMDSRIPAADRPRYEADAEERTNHWSYLQHPALERVHAVPDADCLPGDPFEQDRRARALVKQSRIRDRVLSRDVRIFRQLGLWREAGFISFEHYVKERL